MSAARRTVPDMTTPEGRAGLSARQARTRGPGYEVELCPQGFVVLATEDAPEREPGEVVAGAYSQRARANRVCRHLNAGWSPAEANRYEWPNGRMAAPRPLA